MDTSADARRDPCSVHKRILIFSGGVPRGCCVAARGPACVIVSTSVMALICMSMRKQPSAFTKHSTVQIVNIQHFKLTARTDASPSASKRSIPLVQSAPCDGFLSNEVAQVWADRRDLVHAQRLEASAPKKLPSILRAAGEMCSERERRTDFTAVNNDLVVTLRPLLYHRDTSIQWTGLPASSIAARCAVRR